MLAAGGAGVWEEVLAATSGQQKQIKMRYFFFFTGLVILDLPYMHHKTG